MQVVGEEELVSRMKQGEREAFDALYERYYDKLYRTACMITGNRADGEDVAQETFIKVYLHCAELKKDGQFRYWLYQILNRTAWQLAKKHVKEQPKEQILRLADKAAVDSPVVQVLKDERDRAVVEAVRKLEYRQRAAVILYYYNGLSTKEIAKVMECMEGTVKSRLFTARKNLKLFLKKEMGQEDRYGWLEL